MTETIYTRPELVRSRFVTVDGYRTHYLESGPDDGQPVVLVHGANWDFGLGADRWFPTIVPLGLESFRVVAPDQLGGGLSDPPRDLVEIGNLQHRAQHMLDFVEGLGGGPIHLVGQSQGAWIAGYIALRRPDLVGRLVIVDSSSVAMPPGGLSAKGLAPKFEVQVIPGTLVNRRISEGDDVEGGVREWLEANVVSPDVLVEPYLRASLDLAERWAPIWREPWRASWEDPAGHQAQYLLDGEHLGTQVHRLGPSLLVWRKDPAPIFASGVGLYERMSPGSEFYALDRADHFLWQDRPAVFNDVVAGYLRRNS